MRTLYVEKNAVLVGVNAVSAMTRKSRLVDWLYVLNDELRVKVGVAISMMSVWDAPAVHTPCHLRLWTENNALKTLLPIGPTKAILGRPLGKALSRMCLSVVSLSVCDARIVAKPYIVKSRRWYRRIGRWRVLIVCE